MRPILRRWLLLAAAVCLLALAGCSRTAPAEAVAGILDLSQHELAGPIPLDGEWAFHWQDQPTPTGMTVPGGWEGYPAEGYATYRLTVRLPEGQRGPYALVIPPISTAYRLAVDGQVLSGAGIPGSSKAETTPRSLPGTVTFTPQHSTITISVAVANFHHRVGGIRQSISLGPGAQVVRRQQLAAHGRLALLSAIGIMAFYHLILFCLHRRDRSALYFGLLCLLIVMRLLVQGDHTLVRLFPAVPYEAEIRLEYLTGYLGLAALALFVGNLFPREMGARAVAGMTGGTALLAAITLTLPVRLASELIPPYEILLSLCLVYIVVALIRATVRGREGGRLFLTGVLLLGITVIHDILTYRSILSTPALIPVGLIALILCQAALLARRSARAFAENEKLLAAAQTHLREMQHSRQLLTAREEHLRTEVAEMLHGQVQTRLLIAGNRLHEALRLWEGDAERSREMCQAALTEIDAVRDQDVRQVSHLLHPSIIQIGLIPAVRQLAGRYASQLAVAIEVDPALAALDNTLVNGIPETHRLAAYRVLEEALNNVCSHAGIDQVAVTLALTPAGLLRITVRDEGRGIDAGRVQMGLGLRAIAARVEELGGAWQLKGRPGEGTALQVDLPLRAASDPSDRPAPR